MSLYVRIIEIAFLGCLFFSIRKKKMIQIKKTSFCILFIVIVIVVGTEQARSDVLAEFLFWDFVGESGNTGR